MQRYGRISRSRGQQEVPADMALQMMQAEEELEQIKVQRLQMFRTEHDDRVAVRPASSLSALESSDADSERARLDHLQDPRLSQAEFWLHYRNMRSP